MAAVAEGKFDGMITLRPTWEWDVAAGVLIRRRAVLCVIAQETPYTSTRTTPQSKGLIAQPTGCAINSLTG